MESGNSLLEFTDLVNLNYWSVAFLKEQKNSFKNKFEFIPISKILERSKDIINIDDTCNYKRVTIKLYSKGVLLRDEIKGSEIGVKRQYIASKGQFIMSKIDARNGAFGIVPDFLDGAIVTNDFPLFNIDTNIINPNFFFLLTSTNVFIDLAKSCSSGTTNRQRIDIDKFLNFKVPLPTLQEQQEIVEAYFSKINEAKQLELKANNIDQEIEQYLFTELGISTGNKIEKKKGLNFVEFKDLSRWDGVNQKLFSSIYPIYKIGDIIKTISTGTTPPTNRPEYFNGSINFYTPTDLGNEMYLINASRTITEKAITDKKARVFEKGTILFVGIGSTVGKVGIVKNEIATCNQQITGFNIKDNVLVEYVFYFLHYFKNITISGKSISTIPIINQDKIVNIPIALPSLNKQKEILDFINMFKQKKSERVLLAEQLRHQANEEFEKAIFQ